MHMAPRVGTPRAMMPRFWPMFRKEFIQMRRDRLTLMIMTALPVAQLLLFGFAIQTDVRHLPTLVLDQSRTPESRDLVRAFENTGNFRIVGFVDERPELDRAIARGDAQAGIIVPYDYPRRLARREAATVQVVVDAADPLSSQSAIAAAAGVAQVRNLAILSAAAGRTSIPIDARVRPLYNPGLRSPNYIVPGLVGVILTLTMVLVTAMAVVRERERGTLEQLIVTPITRTELMLGKIAPYVGVGLFQMTAVLIIGRYVFDVPLTGNVLLLYAIALLFIIASLALGLVISTLVRTQQQAMQVSFFFVLPEHPALRLHVPAAGDAVAVSVGGVHAPADPFPDGVAWHPLKGGGARCVVAGGGDTRRVRGAAHCGGGATVP